MRWLRLTPRAHEGALVNGWKSTPTPTPPPPPPSSCPSSEGEVGVVWCYVTPLLLEKEVMMMKWCLMSSDVGWHIRDKLFSCDQCRSMVQYSFTSTETRRLVRTDSPGRLPRLSHSSWNMDQGQQVLFDVYLSVVRMCSPRLVSGWSSYHSQWVKPTLKTSSLLFSSIHSSR